MPETGSRVPRTPIMVPLLMDLVRLECRIAGLATAAGLDDEAQRAMTRATSYLEMRADETRGADAAGAERRRRFRAWLRGAT